jgi:hypothetical protein
MQLSRANATLFPDSRFKIVGDFQAPAFTTYDPPPPPRQAVIFIPLTGIDARSGVITP